MNRWIIITIISFVVIVVLLSLTVFKSRIKSAFYIDHMERPERTERMHIARIVETLNIQAGDIIADIGAGSGLFAREFAVQATSSGKIYAVDINSEILKHIDQTSKEKGITNIITIHSSENDPKIQGKVDLIFMCDTLHYI
ncbi:MAG TPA: class I SAM-dependent methyltransferase, partial [Spirochaetota bacterium]|nr:class I SAM-dependent methyltransferase [Spirochaetota bacterium]